MKLSALMSGVLRVDNADDSDIKGITCDSRRVCDGWVFVCVPGVNMDGHDFAHAAEEAGAAVIVAERDTGCARQLIVPHARTAWAVMSANWFGNPARKLRLIGVTGTNGKTSVTYMIKSVLEACGHKTGLIGTIQNLIGSRILPSSQTTPDPYDLQSMLALMFAEGCTFAVMEVSSHALSQQRVEGLHFETAIFTNLTQDHLDYHKTMENYLEAKRALFTMCDNAVINADDEWSGALSDGLSCLKYTYSTKLDEADFTAKNIRPHPDGMDFELVTKGAIGRVRLGIPGQFSVYNALAAAACALSLGFSFDKVITAVGNVPGIKGRMEVVPTGRDFTVIIDYAHTPDAIEKVCSSVKSCTSGRLITLFGCGGDRDRTKRPLMGAAAARLSDFVIITSDNPRNEDPAEIIADIMKGIPAGTSNKVIENRSDAIFWAIENAGPGDVVLLAGKGHETCQVLADGCVHLDEREIVAQALRELKQ